VARTWHRVANLEGRYAASVANFGRTWAWPSNVVPSPKRARPLGTPKSLAERLGVDRTTVARWEAGEYEPQPLQRPRLAAAFGVSLCDFNQLLSDAGTRHAVEESAAVAEASALPGDARTLLNELAVTASVSGVTWEEFMRWRSRREVLKHGVAATVVPGLGLKSAASAGTSGYAVAEPSAVLAALPGVSWASPIYEAVLNPTDTARRAASDSEADAGGHLGSAAAASARRGDRREAQTALKAADVCTTDLNEERCDLGTVFGPTNVAIHQVAVAIELGDASEAMRHVPKVNLNRMPSQLAERRARFLIDCVPQLCPAPGRYCSFGCSGGSRGYRTRRTPEPPAHP